MNVSLAKIQTLHRNADDLTVFFSAIYKNCLLTRNVFPKSKGFSSLDNKLIVHLQQSTSPFLMDKLITHTDSRGCLTIVEALKDFPFTIDRAYWLHSVPEGAERGYHASRSCYEYLVAMCGSVEIVLEDAKGRQTYVLSKKDEGLVVPPYTWIELKNFSSDAVLLVLASDGYQPESYINDYNEFRKEIL